MANEQAAKPTPEEEAAAAAQAAADAQARAHHPRLRAQADKAATSPTQARVGDATRYLVLHGAVAEWPQGTIITGKQLRDIGADDDRIRTLIDNGAIAEHADKE